MKVKELAVAKLHKHNINDYNLSTTDIRLETYIRACYDNPDEHNAYELLAINRFLNFLGKYDFRSVEVKRFIYFYEHIPFTGKRGQSFYDMTPVQVFQIANIKGFYYPEYVDDVTGEVVKNRRLCTEALLFVPRKFGKTTQLAGFACEELLFGDDNAQVFVGANGYDQAKICFDEIRNIAKGLDPKMRRFKVNREQIFNLSAGKTSFARCLASNPDKLDGLNASLVILDEFSQSDTADLKNVLTTSMGVRENPLTMYITTASGKRETPFYEMLQHFKAILRGEAEDDTIFAHIFEPDEDDEESDMATWMKVQPHMGVTVRPDFYKNEYKNALRSAEDMQAFRNKLLNVFTSGSVDAWFTHTTIERLYADAGNLFAVQGYASVDLSVRDDFSVVTYLLHTPTRRDEHGSIIPWHSVSHYYIPSATVADHPNSELYKKWIDAGYMHEIAGETIDYRRIAEDIISSPYDIRAVGYDSYKSREFVNIMKSVVDGRRLIAVPQTYGAFTSPVESMEIAILHRQITFDRNPITAYCFANSALDEDRMENKKPIKISKNGKIDSTITNLMCIWLHNNLS